MCARAHRQVGYTLYTCINICLYRTLLVECGGEVWASMGIWGVKWRRDWEHGKVWVSVGFMREYLMKIFIEKIGRKILQFHRITLCPVISLTPSLTLLGSLSLVLSLTLPLSPLSPTFFWWRSQQLVSASQVGKVCGHRCARVGLCGRTSLIFESYFTHPKSESHYSWTVGFMKTRATFIHSAQDTPVCAYLRNYEP